MDVNMMWMNNKQQVLMPSMVRGYEYESWEERAFAEDAARGIGGFIWPPRSYTCSFCRREFKSAQALGGHMNVHRRDRAKLKQALSPTSSETILHTTTTFVTSENSPNAVGDEMKRESAKDKEEQHVSTKLCMGLRLDEVGNNKCKRLKSGDNFILVDHPCVVVRSSSSQLHQHEAAALHGTGVIQSKMSLMEELDLELRLGV
ncbi:unnamed protein product [Rhodiola kirilowii]